MEEVMKEMQYPEEMITATIEGAKICKVLAASIIDEWVYNFNEWRMLDLR